MCPCGPGTPPPMGEVEKTKFGFTIRERVQIVGDSHFKNWHGHVRAFDSSLVAVDLDEPPAGHRRNGQWFRPENLKTAPQ